MSQLITKATPKKITNGEEVYLELKSAVVEAGILARSYRYYAFMTLFDLGGFFFSVYQLYHAYQFQDILLWGLLAAFFTGHTGGLFHDAGHQAIFTSRKNNDLLGNIIASFSVTSYGWWRFKHNKHHASPNQEGEDPDVELPFLSFTKERFNEKKGFARLLRRYQHYLYFPLGSLVALSLRRDAFLHAFRQAKKRKVSPILIYTLGFFAWFILPFFVFDFGKALFVVVGINFFIGLYFFHLFAPNHKGMPHIDKGVKLSFFEHQIITARNITPGWFTDFMYMGLNYQIEHHLFPNCPRNKLHKITPFLLEICRKMKLEYTQVGILETDRIIVGELKKIAVTARG